MNNRDIVEPLRSMVFLYFGSNVGYAVAPLETLFFETLLELGGMDMRNVHFAYPTLRDVRPMSLPADFDQIVEFDFTNKDPSNHNWIAKYVRKNHISLGLFFDAQPVNPLFRRLRQAGTKTLLSYWGAPISSVMPSWKLALKQFHIRFSRSKLDGLIFESRAMAEYAVRGRGVSREHIDIVPLGVDINLFTSSSDLPYRLFGFPENRKIIFYAGHMEQREGVHILVEAAIELLCHRKRQDVCFLICGNRPGEQEQFQKMYQGLGIDHLIVFGGYRKDIPQILPCCICGVIPSVGWDSFPRTSLEIAASGIPVVASRLQGIPEAVLDGETGLLFEPGNVQQLTDCLCKLLDNPLLAKELGRRGRERCEREYTLEVQRRRLLNVIKRRYALSLGVNTLQFKV